MVWQRCDSGTEENDSKRVNSDGEIVDENASAWTGAAVNRRISWRFREHGQVSIVCGC